MTGSSGGGKKVEFRKGHSHSSKFEWPASIPKSMENLNGMAEMDRIDRHSAAQKVKKHARTTNNESEEGSNERKLFNEPNTRITQTKGRFIIDPQMFMFGISSPLPGS